MKALAERWKPIALLLCLILLALTLTTFNTRLAPQTLLFERVGLSVVMPLQQAIASLAQRLSGFWNGYVNLVHVRQENLRLQSLRTKSLRGKILDRHGQVLADNRVAYTLMAIPADLPAPEDLVPLLRPLNIDFDPETLRPRRRAAALKPVPLQRDFPRDQVAYFAEHRAAWCLRACGNAGSAANPGTPGKRSR